MKKMFSEKKSLQNIFSGINFFISELINMKLIKYISENIFQKYFEKNNP